ncbi:WTM2 (YOR229W) and UME1 (YPL139C) [Zygosaccharomyces parabailii]|nr:WTM2 (YOR229W) and UME1 (YPL139C) [Zygosaccharomyces parabailii]CDH08756.1 related to WTM1-Transcriptional modulator [Zygosaccharomyces bailii ISA1307]
MAKDTKVNKIKNEEFKIWKKSVPALYQHISYLKPRFDTHETDLAHFEKRIAFSHKVVSEEKKGLLTAEVLYSQESDIYKVDCELPLGLSDEANENELIDPDYESPFKGAETKPLSASWNYQGETIIKFQQMASKENSLVALASNGSLAWFNENVKVPVHIMQEIMGPGTSFSCIHSLRSPNKLAVCDFALSPDLNTVVKSQSNGKEGESIVKIVDNAEDPGALCSRINVPSAVTHSVRFLNNHLFATCSNDNIIRFWDIRTDTELWSLNDPNDGKLTTIDTSSLVGNLFASGSDTGVIKLWDLRAVLSKQGELVSFYHPKEDPVVDLQFSPTSSSGFLSVGKMGSVYHWDSEYFFENDTVDDDDLQTQCLKFLHTGGSRRSVGPNGKRNMVAWHPTIDALVGTVDNDCSITLYKPFTGREEEEQAAEGK